MKKQRFVYLLSGLMIFALVGFADNSEAIQIQDLIVVASNSNSASGASGGTDVPMGQGSDQVSLLPEDSEVAEDAYESEYGGYFHPYLNIQGEFTDNLYNLNDNKTDSFITRVSPGIWFALPRKKVIPITITPHNTSAGGLQYQLKDRESTDRYVAYALAGVDLKYYTEDSDLNDTDGVGEGLLRYNFRGGLSLQALDRYSKGEDIFGAETAIRRLRGRFDSNLFMATVDWEITEKLRFKFDYSNFYLNYDEQVWNFKNRSDNAGDLYGFFQFSEKTSVFLEYKYIDVAYDVASLSDNTQNLLYGGISWDTTDKLTLLFKVGYQDKAFDNEVYEDYDGLALDFQTTYRYSEKTNMEFSFYYVNEESDSTFASDKNVFGLNFGYNQKFSEKLSGTVFFQFENAEYNQTVDNTREDMTVFFRPGVQYLFREWLRGEVAYIYDQRDSNGEIYDYKTNTFLVNLSLAM